MVNEETIKQYAFAGGLISILWYIWINYVYGGVALLNPIDYLIPGLISIGLGLFIFPYIKEIATNWIAHAVIFGLIIAYIYSSFPMAGIESLIEFKYSAFLPMAISYYVIEKYI